MKKIILVLFLMATIPVFAKDSGAQIAVINMSELVKAYPGTESSEEVLREQLEEFEAEKEDMMKKMEAKQLALREMARQSEDPALSEKAVAEKRKVFEKEMEEFGQYRQDMLERLKLRQQQIGDEKRRLQKRIFEELSEVVAKYAKKNDYSMVIDSSALIYSEGKTEITEDILKLIEK